MGRRGGFGGLLSQVEGMAKEAARDQQRQQRELAKAESQLHNLLQKMENTAKKLHKTPIKDFQLHYLRGEGLACEAADVSASGMTAQIAPFDHDNGDTNLIRFKPLTARHGPISLTPLELLVSEYGVVFALSVEVEDGAENQPLDWINPSKPQLSQIVLVDPENAEYYYPKETDLLGEAIAGRPRTGIVVFQSLRAVTSSLEVHFSNVLLTGAEDTQSFTFAHQSDDLRAVAEYVVTLPPFHVRLVEELYGPGVDVADVWPGRAMQPSGDPAAREDDHARQVAMITGRPIQPTAGSAARGDEHARQVALITGRPAHASNRAVAKQGGCSCAVLACLVPVVTVLLAGLLVAG